MKTDAITITLTLSENRAWELAQFIKRIGYNTVLHHTDGGDDAAQCETMISGLEAVRRALAEKGVAPR